jgi:hypothetical protein
MRAKFIYEKFTQESDPIEDLGIGTVISCKVGDQIKVKDKYSYVYLVKKAQQDNIYKFSKNNNHTNAWLFPENLVCIIRDIKRSKNVMSLTMALKSIRSDCVYNKGIQLTGTYKLFLKYFEKVK